MRLLWRCPQDFFEAGVLPSDTDFRMLSASYAGALPGIDLALLLDSAAYHMTADTPDRIRPGTLQAGPAASSGCSSHAVGCICINPAGKHPFNPSFCLHAPLLADEY